MLSLDSLGVPAIHFLVRQGLLLEGTYATSKRSACVASRYEQAVSIFSTRLAPTPASIILLRMGSSGKLSKKSLTCHDSSFRNTIFLLQQERYSTLSTGTPELTAPACMLYNVN